MLCKIKASFKIFRLMIKNISMNAWIIMTIVKGAIMCTGSFSHPIIYVL